MGKLIRNGIEYGGGNGTDIFEVTQAEYDALVQAGTLVHNALYVITDAPNLNATAQEISYDGGADTVWDKVESLLPTAYTQATRSSALSSGALGFAKIGKVVIANLNYTTNTSNVSTHDTVLYSDLPPAVSNIYLNFVDEVGNVVRVRVGTDGKMHLHYSTITANKEINGSFVYLSA